MPGQPPVVADVTAVVTASAAAVLVSPVAAAAASVVTCWRTPACQWLLLPLLAMLMALLAATCGSGASRHFHSSEYAVHSPKSRFCHQMLQDPPAVWGSLFELTRQIAPPT